MVRNFFATFFLLEYIYTNEKIVLKPEIEIIASISLLSPNRDALVEAPLCGDDGLAERADHLPERARLQGARNK